MIQDELKPPDAKNKKTGKAARRIMLPEALQRSPANRGSSKVVKKSTTESPPLTRSRATTTRRQGLAHCVQDVSTDRPRQQKKKRRRQASLEPANIRVPGHEQCDELAQSQPSLGNTIVADS